MIEHRIRIALAQINTVVGDLTGNVKRCLNVLSEAEEKRADLCIFPELTITGYPPEDLLLKPGFVVDNLSALDEVVAGTGGCAAIIGYVAQSETATSQREPTRQMLANAAVICANGEVIGTHHKRLLPNYGVFDEERWFEPGSGPLGLYEIAGGFVGVTICEDIWSPLGPAPALGRAGADLIANINSSPYSRSRLTKRVDMLTERAHDASCAIAYVNQVGGQDELVFDGASVVIDKDGTLVARGKQFEEDFVVVDFPLPQSQKTKGGSRALEPERAKARGHVHTHSVSTTTRAVSEPMAMPSLPDALDPSAEVYEALVLGTRDYLLKNTFTSAIIGVSGGIDSSLVATIAVDALGPSSVHAYSMPSRYSSEGSRTDAVALCKRLGIELTVIPIEKVHATFSTLLAEALGNEPLGLTDENLQSRLRGVILMAISNASGAIVLATGNKSEMATGYSTLYGDSAGGFAVIKDVPKTLVYELCAYRNALGEASGEVAPIPTAVIDKPPSAELRPDQRDDQSLPSYGELDPVLEGFVELDQTGPELIKAGFGADVVAKVVALVDGAEYKRRQMPPGVRISEKAFGKDRRMPITNHYRPSRG